MKIEKALKEKFSSLFFVRPGTRCWIWSGTVGANRYGSLYYRMSIYPAHRLSAAIYHGLDMSRSDIKVLHSCDRPCCVNPDHLVLGTQRQNVRDMLDRGRNRPPRGQKNAHVKLTDAQVLSIASSSRKIVDIARELGVTNTCVWSVKSGVNWSHLTGIKRGALR
jgi:hypothetical protein